MKNKKQAVGLIIFVALIGVAGIYLGRNTTVNRVKQSSMIHLNKVTTYVKDESGEEHFLDTRIAVDLEDESNVDVEALSKKTEDIISKLKYEDITGHDGITYIKEAVKKGINESMPDAEIKGIYITDMISDFDALSDTEPTWREKVLKSLFPNMK